MASQRPPKPDAVAAVVVPCLDSRNYVMVRDWLVTPLRGDRRIAQARNGAESPQIAARLAFFKEGNSHHRVGVVLPPALFAPVRQETPNRSL